MIIALLDLPIQPTTEVLGFGLGSSSSQHLPFRFYDQCRRGSSDPTVQRSVFASVDKVPGKPALLLGAQGAFLLGLLEAFLSESRLLEVPASKNTSEAHTQKAVLAFPSFFRRLRLVFQRFVRYVKKLLRIKTKNFLEVLD